MPPPDRESMVSALSGTPLYLAPELLDGGPSTARWQRGGCHSGEWPVGRGPARAIGETHFPGLPMYCREQVLGTPDVFAKARQGGTLDRIQDLVRSYRRPILTIRPQAIVARTSDRGDVRRRSELAGRVVSVYLTLGSLDAAEDVADRIPHLVIRDQVRARILWQRNDTAAMRRRLVQQAAERETAPAFSTLFVLAGMVPEARSSIRDLLPKSVRAHMVDYLEARVALDASNFDRARTLARRALEGEPASHGVAALLYADTMASAENASGHAALAIESLERVTARPAATVHDGAGLLWTAARAHLAMLYRAVGREEEAQTVERELLGLLSTADPDYPLLVDLQQRTRPGR